MPKHIFVYPLCIANQGRGFEYIFSSQSSPIYVSIPPIMKWETCLEAEDLVLEFADEVGLFVTQRLCGFLHGANHRGRSTDHDFDVVRWRRKMGLTVKFSKRFKYGSSLKDY